jgi:histidine triad (HIT) family protein
MKKNESCLFCKIANGTIPCYKVYEDNDVIAFLDIAPATRGHTLVVPKEHFVDMANAPKDVIDKAFEVAQLIAQAEISQLGASGVNVISNIGESAGQSIRHFHIHVIPRYDNDGLKLAFPPHRLEDKEMLLLQSSIKKGM